MKKTLFISAGHGGIDPNDGLYTTKRDQNAKYFRHQNGKRYHRDGEIYEGVINRAMVSEFIAQATRTGYHCVPVFHEWRDTPLNLRTEFANQTATAFGYDSIYLSFHSNAANGRARGFYIFHHPKSRNSKNLASDISLRANAYWNEFGSRSVNPVRDGYMYNPNGTIRGIYHENIKTAMPAVIIENGFFDNEHDADLLMNGEFCVGLCAEILQGVNAYCQK